MPALLIKHQPTTVYILWPSWTRFEYLKKGEYIQSLPSDKDRIYFIETATDTWLLDNFFKQQTLVRNICRDINLIELTLDDLIPYMDHADRWPLSKLGHHYAPEWHQRVAEIFNAT